MKCVSTYVCYLFWFVAELTHNHFTALFPKLPGWASARRKSSSGLYGTRADIRGKHTNNLALRHSIRTNQRPTSLIPHFYAGYRSCRNPPNLSWLGTGTKYAGLHIQWLGFVAELTCWLSSVDSYFSIWSKMSYTRLSCRQQRKNLSATLLLLTHFHWRSRNYGHPM